MICQPQHRETRKLSFSYYNQTLEYSALGHAIYPDRCISVPNDNMLLIYSPQFSYLKIDKSKTNAFWSANPQRQEQQ